jgi:aminoglycoside N3'-acetyltransferase
MSEHTQKGLAQGMQALGIEAGDVLFVHSSFKSLGTVEQGAATVVSAFESVLGEEGLLLMPSFNLKGDRDVRSESWDLEKTPSSVGWLTEFFRRMPGTVRSDHYSHSVAARGAGAAKFVSDHLSNTGFVSPWDRVPWGRTYGSDSPMIRAYDRGGKILMLGVDYETSTYMHVVEVTYWNQRLAEDPDAPFIWLDRAQMGKAWDRSGTMLTGKIADVESKLILIREFVDGLVQIVRADPDAYDRVKLGTRNA